eukprot:3469932-Rhodomonas_salina.1
MIRAVKVGCEAASTLSPAQAQAQAQALLGCSLRACNGLQLERHHEPEGPVTVSVRAGHARPQESPEYTAEPT